MKANRMFTALMPNMMTNYDRRVVASISLLLPSLNRFQASENHGRCARHGADAWAVGSWDPRFRLTEFWGSGMACTSSIVWHNCRAWLNRAQQSMSKLRT